MIVQDKASTIDSNLVEFKAKLEKVRIGKSLGAILNTSPPMFSSEYFSQFGSHLWVALENGMDEIINPGRRLKAYQGWAIFIQGFFSLLISIGFYKRKDFLNNLEQWRFLAMRPFAGGLFIVSIIAMLIYEYQGIPVFWKTANNLVGGISLIFLLPKISDITWRKQFVFGIVVTLIITQVFYVTGLPLPIFRLFYAFLIL